MENRFYLARMNAKLTQQSVSEALGVQKTAVSKWECGRTIPDGRMIKRVAELYCVSSDYLLDLADDPALFDDARVPKSEIQELYDDMTPTQQQKLIAYAQGLLAAGDSQNIQSRRRA